jgi:hypothetical protein
VSERGGCFPSRRTYVVERLFGTARFAFPRVGESLITFPQYLLFFFRKLSSQEWGIATVSEVGELVVTTSVQKRLGRYQLYEQLRRRARALVAGRRRRLRLEDDDLLISTLSANAALFTRAREKERVSRPQRSLQRTRR